MVGGREWVYTPAARNPEDGRRALDWASVASTTSSEMMLQRVKYPNTEKNSSNNLLVASQWKEEFISTGSEGIKSSFETEIIKLCRQKLHNGIESP